jgi:hypothetical protein
MDVPEILVVVILALIVAWFVYVALRLSRR